ncbi:hypothetical protein TWF696_008880 [Orbilia brochopaga]|uniref:Uncharacterized protein n=1 Tax=Orbilia brochopaga TaxID=3140254 RepID=A0AAV9UDG1_9PEZI
MTSTSPPASSKTSDLENTPLGSPVLNSGITDPPPFLRLPIEIHNEIYKYLVLFDPESPDDTSYFSIPCARPVLNLSILRVNKLIHDEASRILYTDNTFPIHIQTHGVEYKPEFICHSDVSNCERLFQVQYDSFWEKIEYQRDPSTNETSYYTGDVHQGGMHLKAVPEDEAEVVLFPSPRYRNLVRRLRLFIHMMRDWEYYRSKPSNLTDEMFRQFARTLFIPLVQRLRDILGEGSQHAHLDLVIWSDSTRYYFRHFFFQNAEVINDGFVADLPARFFFEAAWCVWPLTRGPWSYTLRMADPYFKRFEEIKDKALQQCDEDPALTEAEQEHLETVELKDGYTWAIEDRKMVVVDEGTILETNDRLHFRYTEPSSWEVCPEDSPFVRD